MEAVSLYELSSVSSLFLNENLHSYYKNFPNCTYKEEIVTHFNCSVGEYMNIIDLI